MKRAVRDWISNLVLAALVAVVTLALVLPAQGQTITWKVDGPAACTVTCNAAAPVPVPPGPPPPAPPVEPPPSPPGNPAADPCAQYAGNFLLYSYCQQGAVTPGPIGGTGSSLDRCTGFVVERRGCPYSNTLVASYTYQYVLDTATGERVELTILEVVGTPDSMSTVSRVTTASGALVSPPVASGRHGKHDFSSPGGRLTFFLTPSVSGPLGVQRN